MKGGLWETDLSELAQLYSKYKEYIGLRNLETNLAVVLSQDLVCGSRVL